ncbi:MAG: hypothetical protein KJ000_05940 [Pirellulaceae bacterium]|nr:hypothetical protein [Pirellulaceae bacterium]
MKPQATHRPLRLEIDPVIERAERLSEKVQQELADHQGLIRAARGIADAAHEAKRVARALRRPLGPHRLPAAFAALALLGFAAWIYWNFFHVAKLRIALPVEDATQLHERLTQVDRMQFEIVLTEGSQESLRLLMSNEADLAFLQGGIPVPGDLPRRTNPSPELVLYFVRQGVQHPQDVRRILTSAEGQGSHCVAREFARIWEIDDRLEFVHDWRRFKSGRTEEIPADIDAVFLIKDIADGQTLEAAERLDAAGFRLASPHIGAHAFGLDYLKAIEIPAGHLSQTPSIPEQTLLTYSVATYLVARPGLTPRLLAAAGHLLDTDADSLVERGYEPTLGGTADVLQGLEAFLSVLVYIGLAFLALLGWEVTTYRRRFHELNTLISLISMHQGDKDVLGLTCPAKLRENLLYLSICSDLLSLISVIGGYYSQENSSLLYSNLLSVIYERADRMKLNIQTKIMHSSISLAPAVQTAFPEELPEESVSLADGGDAFAMQPPATPSAHAP